MRWAETAAIGAAMLVFAGVASAQSSTAGSKPAPLKRGVILHPATTTADQPIVTASPQPVVTPVVAVMSPANPAQPMVRRCARPLTATDMKLTGGDDAARLAGPLKRGRTLTIDLAEPYAPNGEPPAALAPWFAAVKTSGGSIDAQQYCEQTSRGLFNWLFGRRKADNPGQTYAAADHYNAVVHVDLLLNKVTQVEFVPRTAAKH